MTDPPDRSVAILAVDGGNSKTDVALLGWDGRLLAAIRGPTTSHQQVGLENGARLLGTLVEQAADRAGLAAVPAAIGSFALAGADTRGDVGRLRASVGRMAVADEVLIVNDAFAPIRAGSDRGWGVGLICGAGVNAAGIAPDGRTARLAALGPISGDWGGGGDVGLAALGAAVRARDGRGQRTALETAVPRHFGFRRPMDLTMAIERDRLSQERLRELSPVVFDAARAGDVVARRILDRLADELATMGIAIIRRLHLTRLDVEVVLAGGVFRATDPELESRVTTGIVAVVRRATVLRLDAPPVVGAALFGLDELLRAGRVDASGFRAATRRIRGELTFDAYASG